MKGFSDYLPVDSFHISDKTSETNCASEGCRCDCSIGELIPKKSGISIKQMESSSFFRANSFSRIFSPRMNALFISIVLFSFIHLSASAAVPSKCHEYEMQQRNNMAGVVVSGTVQKLMADEAHSTKEHHLLKGLVTIKRIFKGEKLVESVATTKEGRLRPMKIVMIEGFGDPAICDNSIRERETKIFMLNPNGNGELKLNSSIVPLTMNNLDYVDAVIKDIPFTTPEPVTVSPCYLQFCPFGATCRVNETAGTPMCVCEQKCSQVFAPVCGSDGATYSNLCMLNRGSCIRKRKIRVKSQGVCGVRDPCEELVCKFGAECMPSIDGKIARCQCPKNCASYGDSVGSKPVCGNDGKDYKNICELKSAACYQLKDIRVKYYGKCDPCEGFECEPPKVCHVNSNREPECHCNYICFNEINLVCGTDGRTYSNQCVLKKQACKSRKDIRVLQQGQCSPDNNPCSKLKCGPEEECTVDRTGRASCVCPPRCQPVLRRVCGNDSITYDNECELRRQSCLNKVYVTVAHPGGCNSDSPCSSHRCQYGAVCVEHGNKPKCQCPQCSDEYDPVCGDNGIIYENECKLRHEMCLKEEEVRIKKKGACDDCGKSRCDFYAVCDNSQGNPTCVCPTSCALAYNPVCGSDGKTYPNECELRVKSCQQKIFLSITSTGSCDKCENVTCKFSAKCENGLCVCPILCPTIREPVCASDDNSYINKCEMRKMACTKSIDLDVVSEGECETDSILISGSGEGSGDFTIDDEDAITTRKPKTAEACSNENCVRFGGTCELDGLEFKCSCIFKCPATRQYVCGSDGQTHGNECMMLHTSCIKKQIITKQSMDNCDELDDEVACDGLTPLVNPDTGKDYDCGDGKELCPARSFCHKSDSFSKCCKQESEAIRNCSESEFGCCKDQKTPALASRGGGCPDVCGCHPLGSYSTTCDPRTRQCTCKPGVGGKRCDRCEIGYWGMQSIETHGNAGCIPCNCNKLGSHRDDCEQMTGRCMCHPSVIGMKCDQCRKGYKLGPKGCTQDSYEPMTCQDLDCQYGATCRQEATPVCVCEHRCDVVSHKSETVCGSNGQNYGSQCQMELYACRMQMDLMVKHKGYCKGAPPTQVTTPSPVTKSRKTTRHISDNHNSNLNNGDNEDNQKDNNQNESQEEKPPSEENKKEETCTGSNIEDLCLSDEDCCPNNSYCRGLCYCNDGYIPSIDNTKCFEVKKKPPKNESKVSDACSGGDLCESGAECVPDDYLGYRCACPIGKAGPRCDKNIDFINPSFSGRSHLELPHIEDASQDLSIDIVFSSLNQDGIILFNAKFKNGTGDFISLSVKGGFVEFRYDLGGGPAILRSQNPIEPKSSHRVNARRSKNMGELIVDSEDAVRGSSPSTHNSLDLNDPMYLGYVPNVPKQIYEKVGVDLGLVGCIYSLRAGSPNNMYSYSLASNDPYSDIIKGTDITECGKNPCKSMPCLNGATCLVLDAQIFECRCRDGYKGQFCEKLMNPCASEPCQYGGTCLVTSSSEGFFCQCPHGREGARCEKELIPQLFVPQFIGDSYMQMPLEERIFNSLSITVWFKALKPNGVLFFATQSPGGRGDFIALNMRNKKLIYTFFLGSEIGRIVSARHIHLDKWHEVTVTRTGREGQMSIDGHPAVKGTAGGSSTLLNIDNRPLFVGGYNSSDDLPPRAGIENGLTGAIQRIIINGRTIDGLMASALTMRNISPYNGPPCNVNPCMNDGVCIPMLNRVECRCPTGFVGKNCEKRYDHVDKDQPLQFDGLTYLSYPNDVTRKQKGQKSNSFKVVFRTREPDGVILLQRGGDSVEDDYLSLAISGGFAEFSYNLGKQDRSNLHIIRSKEKVNDRAWHTVFVERSERKGILKVDDGEEVVGSSLEGTKQLDTDGLLWVGGHLSLPWYLPTSRNFVGCIDKVEVNGKELHLLDDKYDRSSSIAFCT